MTVRALRRWTLLLAALVGTAALAGPAQADVAPRWSTVRLDATTPRLPAGPLRTEVQVVVDGRPRTFRLLVPPGAATPAPLVVGLHGLYRTADATEAAMRLLEQAPARGFIAAYPAGVGASWNAGRCCGRARAEGHGWPSTRTPSGYDTSRHVLDFLLRSRQHERRQVGGGRDTLPGATPG